MKLNFQKKNLIAPLFIFFAICFFSCGNSDKRKNSFDTFIKNVTVLQYPFNSDSVFHNKNFLFSKTSQESGCFVPSTCFILGRLADTSSGTGIIYFSLPDTVPVLKVFDRNGNSADSIILISNCSDYPEEAACHSYFLIAQENTLFRKTEFLDPAKENDSTTILEIISIQNHKINSSFMGQVWK